MTRIRILLWNTLERVILYILKISTKFGVAPQSFCKNQNSVQEQDQDQDHDFTLDFNTTPTFHTHQILFGSANSFESYCVHMKSPHEKCPRTYVRTSRNPDRQTDGNFFVLVLSSKTYKTWTFIKRREFFFSVMRLQYFLFLHTPYVMRK